MLKGIKMKKNQKLTGSGDKNSSELLNCPFCGSPAELRSGELKPTLEKFLVSEKNARCSACRCAARFIVCTVSEWNTRAT